MINNIKIWFQDLKIINWFQNVRNSQINARLVERLAIVSEESYRKGHTDGYTEAMNEVEKAKP